MDVNSILPDKIQLKGLESLFGTNQKEMEQVFDVPVEELFPFRNHPFKILDDYMMAKIVKSVKENGILVPILVRDRPEGGYEIISGHRRKHAAEIAGIKTVPVIIRELTDDEAIIAMVNANIQREEILPSERAFALKMELEAISHQGKKGKTLRQVVNRKRSADIVGKYIGKSGRQVQRYIRLTRLLPELLEMVDKKRIKVNPAVELSYLNVSEQNLLLEELMEIKVAPSLIKAQQIKKLSQEKACTKEAIHAVLSPTRTGNRSIEIKNEVIMKYFPSDRSSEEIESLIIRLLDEYSRKNEGT